LTFSLYMCQAEGSNSLGYSVGRAILSVYVASVWERDTERAKNTAPLTGITLSLCVVVLILNVPLM